MIEFTIEGLTPQQKVLADIIWACGSRDQVAAFVKGLPTKALKQEASNIVDLMIMAVVEQCYDGINPNMTEAQQLINKVSK
jgi:hypothetical protein